MRSLSSLALSLPAVLLCAAMPADALLDRFIFYPEAQLVGTPGDWGMAYEEVWFSGADGTRLHGWFVPGRRPETLIWFHGNAGNISHRIENLRLLHDHVGVHVLLFDYRGYGRSEGQASEPGLYADARGALAYTHGRHDVDPSRIIYFGRSLGSAVAVDLATTSPPHGLILETPFTSVRDMGRTLLGPLAAFLPDRFNNVGKITTVEVPKLFIHGDRDDIVPYSQGQRLYEVAPPPKVFFTIPGATHNDTYIVGGRRYFERLREFIESLGD